MDPGREMDARIATEVMSWTPTRVGIRGQLRFHPPDGQSPTGAYPVDVGPGEEWSPSTEIAAAWQVVEQLEFLGRHIEIRNGSYNQEYHAARGHWLVEVSPFEALGEEADVRVYADTAPHAICLAALAAVEADSGLRAPRSGAPPQEP